MKYPPAPRCECNEEYHGRSVQDPFRTLEEIDSQATVSWIEAENRITGDYLDHLDGRSQIHRRMTELWDFDLCNAPRKKGGRYFWLRNSGLQNQAVLYWGESLTEVPKVLVDPNLLSSDGTVSLINHFPSMDGRYLIYCLSASGSDWQRWRIRDVASGKDLPEQLEWVKFSAAAWTTDAKGFYYSRYDKPAEGLSYKGANYNQKLYYHILGTPQTEDELIYERPDHKEWGFVPQITEDGRYLLLAVWRGTFREQNYYYLDLQDKEHGFLPLRDQFDALYNFIGGRDSVFYFVTDLDAPNSRVIGVDVNKPAGDQLSEIVAESTDTLQFGEVAGGRFLLSYLHDAHSRLAIHELDGTLYKNVELPGIGSILELNGCFQESEAFFSFTGFTTPITVFQLDVDTGAGKSLWELKIDINSDDFITRQVFYESKDGTKVPMFISHHKKTVIDGDCPVFLYGYGGFNNAQTPAFSISNLIWMEMGGLFALANIRGGGEYGKPWHLAGTKRNKQNVFDDFISAAEWLTENNYTCSKRIAIGGRSNGGLLTGACLTQRPDLFGACLVGVGVLDMLRYHKFTIGWAWVSDYGSPDNVEEFEALLAYSPYHNIRPGICYPPTLITTGDHDDRVFPAHSFKFAARLQEAQAGENPVLIRIDTKAGHGMGKPTAKLIDEGADILTFLISAVGAEAFCGVQE